jgi:hypothetical protein
VAGAAERGAEPVQVAEHDLAPEVAREGQGQDLDEFPYFKRWFEELGARPGVQRGMEAGSELSVDYASLTEEEVARVRKLLYNQRARPAPEGGLL